MTLRPKTRRLAFASVLVATLALLLALTAASNAAGAERQLTAADGAALQRLGSSVAVDGDTLVVGAPFADGKRGAVYVFQRSGDSWTQTAKLIASDGAAADGMTFSGDQLGSSVAIDGDTIVAGAPLDTIGANATQGSVYTFARTGGPLRTETAKLTASDGATSDQLGHAVAIDGDTIVAGAALKKVGANATQGVAYTFARTGASARTETARLTASDGAAGDNLGFSVAIDGDTIVAGAPFRKVGTNAEQGLVYTFARTGAATRTQTAELTASDGGAFASLGLSAAIDGDTIVAGAPGQKIGANSEQGAAYTFARTGAAARTETAKLTASDGSAFDILGISVGIDGGTIVAGASGDDVVSTDQGSVFTFARTGAAARSQTGDLVSPEGAAGDQLGQAVGISGDAIVAGAPTDDVGANTDQGSASVFFTAAAVPPPPPPPPPPAAATKPVLSALHISPSTFRVGSSLPRIARSRIGTRITFSLSQAARVKLSFARAEPGRRVGRTCRKPTKANRAKRHCTRYVTVGSFAVSGRRGHNALSFSGRISRTRRLAAGIYLVTATPTSAARVTGRARTARLRIVTR